MSVKGYKIEPGADLSGADLEGATADQRTVWPEGFDPVAAGVIIE